jgi:hypothetical protein
MPDRRGVLHLGRELFRAGSSPRDIQTAVVAVTARWGMQNLEVDISGRSLQVQYAPPRRAPVVMLVVLGSEDTRDLSRLTAGAADRADRGHAARTGGCACGSRPAAALVGAVLGSLLGAGGERMRSGRPEGRMSGAAVG